MDDVIKKLIYNTKTNSIYALALYYKALYVLFAIALVPL